MTRLVFGCRSERQIEVALCTGRYRISSGEQGLPSRGHPAQEQRRHEVLEPLRTGQKPCKRLWPDIHQVDHEVGIEPPSKADCRLRTLQGRQAGQNDVGTIELAGCNGLVGEPLKRAAEVAMAGQPGQRHVSLVASHCDQANGKALIVAGVQRRGAWGLAAVAPVRGPPGDVVAPARQHACQRPVSQRRKPFAGDVVEWVDDPDG